MSNVYYIADLHFGHKNCAKWRGFDTEEGHDDWIVSRWNEVVGSKDTVYILGDLCMHKRGLARVQELHGRKVLVMGNHDSHGTQLYLDAGIDKLAGAHCQGNWLLTHVPTHLGGRWVLNVHGHLHHHRHRNGEEPSPVHHCVSVEQMDDGHPVSREAIECLTNIKQK